MKQPDDSNPGKPTTQRIVLHFVALAVGIALLYCACFVKQFPGGFEPSDPVRVIAVVVLILVFGGYLRRFGRIGKSDEQS